MVIRKGYGCISVILKAPPEDEDKNMAFSVKDYLNSDEYKYKQKLYIYSSDPAKTFDISDALNNWYKQGADKYKKIIDDYNQRKGSYQNRDAFAKYYDEITAGMDSWEQDAEAFKGYLKGLNVSDEELEQFDTLVNGLQQTKSELSKEKDYWGGFESEEDYKKKLRGTGKNADIRGGFIDYNAEKMAKEAEQTKEEPAEILTPYQQLLSETTALANNTISVENGKIILPEMKKSAFGFYKKSDVQNALARFKSVDSDYNEYASKESLTDADEQEITNIQNNLRST
ncbi:MAG: hypothetical protein ACYCX2_12035 [Christensenellales bacterium]